MTVDERLRRAERERFFRSAAEFAPGVLVDTAWGCFAVSTTDLTVGRDLFARGARRDMKMVRRVVQVLRRLGQGWRLERSTFVDVGANVGTTTVAALHKLPFVRAVACEPEPGNLRLLRANVGLNDLGGRVLVRAAAVGESSGTLELVVDPSNSGGHYVGSGPGARSTPVTTLDALAREGAFKPRDVGLIWLDVQGHEGYVLAGASRLRARGVPVLFELYPEGLGTEGLACLVAHTAAPYTHLLDMRRLDRDTDPAAALQPVTALSGIAESLSGSGHTDVLLLSLRDRHGEHVRRSLSRRLRVAARRITSRP